MYGGKMQMLAEVSIVPLGVGESLSEFVAESMKIIEASGLDYRMNPMGTVIMGEYDDVMSVIRKCHMRMMELAPRTVTTIKIDDRRDAKVTFDSKIRSVEKKLGKKLKK
jgi:uncharacterized protein (TIGR00106 family)